MVRSDDVRRISLQVWASQKERNALRFLWWTENQIDKPAAEYKMRFNTFFAVFWKVYANNVLGERAAAHRKPNKLDIADSITSSLYVGDCQGSLGKENTARESVLCLTKFIKKSGFHRTK